MDDRDLEARLSTHLHRRFDDAQPSPDLVRGVEQVFATRPRQLSLPVLGLRSPTRIGFSLTAAAVALIVVAVAASNLGLHLGPSAGGGPSPSPSGPTERTFIVLPPPGSDATSKPEAIIAGDVLNARLVALGVGNFSTGTGYGMTFSLPVGGPNDDEVRAVLAAPGIVQFIPIPAGDPTVVAGQQLPHSQPELFGSEAVANVRDAADKNGNPALNIELTRSAGQVFAEYTAQHVGEQVAIVLDGRVATAPVIQGPITDGTVQITNASPSAGVTLDAPMRAILIGGELPEAWRGAPVPKIIGKEAAVATAMAQPGASDLVHAQADAEIVAGHWRAIWNVEVGGSFPDFPCTASPSPCPIFGIEIVKIDAVNGGVMGFEQASP